MGCIEDESIDLIVTSPPYPMIEMWDDIMASQNSSIKDALDSNDGNTAFELMHKELDRVWDECYRVLKPNGTIICFYDLWKITNLKEAKKKVILSLVHLQ